MIRYRYIFHSQNEEDYLNPPILTKEDVGLHFVSQNVVFFDEVTLCLDVLDIHFVK